MRKAATIAMLLSGLLSAQAEQPETKKTTPKRPRILLIGDRGLDSFLNKAPSQLKDFGEVVRTPLGHLSSGAAIERIDELLGDEGWDLVCFNFGLADLMCRDPRTKEIRVLSPKAGGVPVTPLDHYDDHLAALVTAIREQGASPLFLTTPALSPRSRNTAIDASLIGKYNEAADAVMRSLDVPVLDLWTGLEEQIATRIKGKKGRPAALRDREHINLLKGDLSKPVVARIRQLLAD